MRIVVYIENLDVESGGTVTAVVGLTNALVADGHEVTLLTHRLGSGRRHLPLRAPTLVVDQGGLARGHGVATVATVKRWRAHVLRADVVHLHGVWSVGALQVARLARRAGKPYLVTTHGMLSDWALSQGRAKKAVYLHSLVRPLLRRSAAVVCTSDAESEQVGDRLGPRTVVRHVPGFFDTAHHGLRADPAPGRAHWPDRPDLLRLLYLGRLHPQKGLDKAIDMLAILTANGRDAHLVVAGAWASAEPGYRGAVEARIARAGLAERVDFVGFVTGAAKRSLYAAADLLVSPTVYESFGYVTYEALACGTPAVISDGVATWPELRRTGGVLVAAADGGAFARAFLDLDPDRADLEAMGQQGRTRVLGHGGGTAGLDRYVDLYRSVAGR